MLEKQTKEFVKIEINILVLLYIVKLCKNIMEAKEAKVSQYFKYVTYPVQ
jgi:hypothetical protein